MSPYDEQYANALNEIMSPCKFCGYNGSGYYQTLTHHESCRWRLVGGMHERAVLLLNEKKEDAVRRNLKLEVWSFEMASTYPLHNTDAVISIVSPCCVHPERLIARDHTTFLQFHDINPYGVEERHLTPYKDGLMTKQHAQQILKFYEKIVNKQANISRLIIHCEAGVSRSPAVALALSLIHDLKPSAYRLYRDHCCYNPYVFNMILNQWQTEDIARSIKTKFKF